MAGCERRGIFLIAKRRAKQLSVSRSWRTPNGGFCSLARGLLKILGQRGSGMDSPDYLSNPDKEATVQQRCRRYLTNLPITVSLPGRDLEGYCEDIAEDGLGAFLPEIVPARSVVVLVFVVPSCPLELRVQAVVRYQIGFRHGLEFVALNEAERLAIRQFCIELPSISRA